MANNKANDNVKKAYHQLQASKESLNAALQDVEKSGNKQKIENTANSVENAIESTNSTLANYKD